MAFTMRSTVERYFDSFVISKKQMLGIADAAIREAGQFWVDVFMPIHFQHDAHLRYNYRYRSKKWNMNKYKGRIPPDGFFTKLNRKRGITPPNLWTQIVPHEMGKARPFDARGDMKRNVMSGYKMSVSGRGGGAESIVLKIRLPFGHPIRPEFVGEMTRVNSYEMERLQQKFHAGVSRRIKEGGYLRQQGAEFTRGGYPVLGAA